MTSSFSASDTGNASHVQVEMRSLADIESSKNTLNGNSDMKSDEAGLNYQSMEEDKYNENRAENIGSFSSHRFSFTSFTDVLQCNYSNHRREINRTILSWIIWGSCYIFMGIFGGSVAYARFPRYGGFRDPQPLPDVGYDLIPYFCPMVHPPLAFGNMLRDINPQTLVLFLLYIVVLAGVVRRRAEDGRIILQDLLHLNSLVFLTRMTTVGVTNLPQPNPRCVDAQQYEVTYFEAVFKVMAGSFPPRACGDLIFSGHVSCILVCCIIMHYHGYFGSHLRPEKRWSRIFFMSLVWTFASAGILAVVSCRSHYTVDAILAFYFSFFLGEFYFVRAEARVSGPLTDLILWLKCQDEESLCRNGDRDNFHLENGESAPKSDTIPGYGIESQRQQQHISPAYNE